MLACSDLNLTPLSQATNENWFTDETEITMAIDQLYHPSFWPELGDGLTDNESQRNQLNSFNSGVLSGQDAFVVNTWSNEYKAIARVNTILEHLENLPKDILSEGQKNKFLGECLFMRACRYADLVSLWGDVPYVTEVIDIDEAFKIGRTDKNIIIKATYDDFDRAASLLDVNTGMVQRATKGAAYAMKARFALNNKDWNVVVDATKACMELEVYKLYPNYAELFLTTTHNTEESIFSLPRSVANGVQLEGFQFTTRNAGGWAVQTPTWDLLASYTCTDGLPIDESPLFDPHDPFKNRDPRCIETIVPFNTRFLGFTYAPHPDSLEVINYSTGKKQINNDNRANAQYASFNALVWKKGIDETWLLNGGYVDPDKIVIRYADVLLMYAEAKIELNEIDQSVLDAINMVRSRAYGVNINDINNYPSVTETDQKKLRSIIRTERRVEFAKEGLRYMDLVRWKLNEKVMNLKNYGILYPAELLRENVTDKGYWFWGMVPDIDENGIADFSKLEKAGLIVSLSQRAFDVRQYLWPIPTKEILINNNIKQNPGY